MTDWMLIIGMTILTFVPRYLPFGLAGNIRITPLVTRALNYVPIAVLTAIVVQATLIRGGELSIGIDNHHLLASTVAFMVALGTRHMFLTIMLGLISFALAQWLLGG